MIIKRQTKVFPNSNYNYDNKLNCLLSLALGIRMKVFLKWE